MNTNTKIGMGALTVILMGGAFYGGMQYQKSASATRMQGAGFQRMGMQGAMRGGVTSGEILAKDASGITLKTPDGSTKIVFLSGTSVVSKSASGTIEDLIVGKSVSVLGSENADGSITGQNVILGGMGFRAGR